MSAIALGRHPSRLFGARLNSNLRIPPGYVAISVVIWPWQGPLLRWFTAIVTVIAMISLHTSRKTALQSLNTIFRIAAQREADLTGPGFYGIIFSKRR